MPISRSKFNKQNTILYKTQIIKTNLGRGSNRSADILDINKNGTADWTHMRTGFSSNVDTHHEPALSTPFARIKEQLDTMDQGEVATQEDLQAFQIKNLRVNFSNWKIVGTTVSESGSRNIANVINDVAPLGSDKGVAIDSQTREFLVYSPKKTD